MVYRWQILITVYADRTVAYLDTFVSNFVIYQHLTLESALIASVLSTLILKIYILKLNACEYNYGYIISHIIICTSTSVN